ncbi:MAG: Two-component transcriptional response regulator, LuxR family [uncultured Quadrisphaera sp.]|uniref:Two-component transcriptional response regulator, LuxR family n=1 Tax=uncultured Quadrisphaera sp. TaxID=904978 RepID=A0A6J4Q3C0_9ACTN|nr:MAG: Two-component transcriptional response regulator, LuxR family [uncultured Quadrisphaera sp.]
MSGPSPRGAQHDGDSGPDDVRVLLVDDQALIRLGFRMLLEAEPGITVVGEAADGAQAVSMTRALRPDVVLMDVRMPVLDGVEATRQIVASASSARVLVLTTFDLDEHAFAALRAGASGFLLKDAQPAELVGALRSVAAGDAVVSPRVTRALLTAMESHLPDPTSGRTTSQDELALLTEREREVLVEVAHGRTNAEVASRLVLSEATVKGHVGRVLTKLELRDRVQIVVWAYRNGVVRPGDPADE